jgi:hypothetical protein
MVRSVTTTSRLAAALLAFGLAAGAALAAQPTTTKFEPQMEVQGTRMPLSGCSSRRCASCPAPISAGSSSRA